MSSPRIPTEQRRRPRPKKERRALRDFYGLSNDVSESDPALDSPAFDVTGYLTSLAGAKVTTLLDLENTLIREIRVLDGDRKGLVYDNYGRMITATDTIKNMRTQLEPMTPNRDVFEGILKSIHDLAVNVTEVETDDGMQDWLNKGADRVSQLLQNKQIEAAQDELREIDAELLHVTPETRERVESDLSPVRLLIASAGTSET